MCAITGFVGNTDPQLLRRMCSKMTHRGPDGAGIWMDENAGVGLAHRRLAILDLTPTGHQPMVNADETIILSYNGELYNFHEHRKLLESKGYRFRGSSDTEVVLYLYEEYGPNFVNMLNGMFAIAIWDVTKAQLLLVRDHAGVKPLYYIESNGALYFASEIKALLEVPGLRREVNRSALESYLTFLWVPGDETMFAGIRKLEPGHMLTWREGRSTITRWFNLEYVPDESVTEAEWIERVYSCMRDSTERQMMSDVPLGAFLSGGLDSTSIVACMRNAFPDREITCYAMGYNRDQLAREGFVDDLPFAKKVAALKQINLKTFSPGREAMLLLPKVIYAMDEPDADPTAIVTYMISQAARNDGIKVLLSGTGGDEVFFGYRSHQAYRLYARLDSISSFVTPLMRAFGNTASVLAGGSSPTVRRLNKLVRGLGSRGAARHMEIVDWSSTTVRSGLLNEFRPSAEGRKTRVPECIERYHASFRGSGELNRHSHILIQTFLAAHNFLYGDKCAMATSVETRVPFMDLELMKLCATIPENLKLKGNTTKYILKRAMERDVPREILYRPKTGFTPPLRGWLVEGVDSRFADLLSESTINARGLFDFQRVQQIIKENREGIADHAYLIYALINLELWHRTFIDSAGVEVTI